MIPLYCIFLMCYLTYSYLLSYFVILLELLDEQEFKDDSETNAHIESSLNPAEELGLLVCFFSV